MTVSEELFRRIFDVLSLPAKQQDVRNKLMHDILVRVCREGLKSTRHGFGNLSSQVDSLCRKHKVAPRDVVAIHAMRRHSNSIAPILPDDFAYDCRALVIFVSAVFGEAIPAFLTGKIPTMGRHVENIQLSNYKCIRCTVLAWDDATIKVGVLNQAFGNDCLVVDYASSPDYIDFTYLRFVLRVGMQLNLLDCGVVRNHVQPKIIVVEPDYLLDISAVANCFEDYGHHPLLFTVNRMKPRTLNRHTLLGNFAGAALDNVINHPECKTEDIIRSNFRDKALDHALCGDFNVSEFLLNAKLQVKHIREIVDEIFATYKRDKAILEPSFVCEHLGLQGRVDLMTTDLQLLVEQKSGKNFYLASHRPNKHGSLHIEKHYVQVLLYFGILQYNFLRSGKSTDIRLLYSKYPLPDGLLEVEPLQKLMMEAIKFRNQVVATEYWMANNDFSKLIPKLIPQTLKTEKCNEGFYNRYVLPDITAILKPLHGLSPLEKSYFCRMMRFVVKEQIISKVGFREGTGSCNADLWNMPLAQKIETGNIYVGLTIKRKARSTAFSGYDTITLNVPELNDEFLPNFRRGDMIYLYSYKKGNLPDVRKSILFKGSMEAVSDKEITVHLNDGQQNPDLIAGDFFAVEHGGSDIGSATAIQGLHTFITANEKRKQLLLGQRPPLSDKSLRLTRDYHPDYDEIILKAKQAQDCFLLVGPPGTGKTSMALQFLVREQLAENENASVLLLSYTNRAVDEICGMLSDTGIDYVRIGNENSCSPVFKSRLLSNVMAQVPTLEGIRQTLANAHVIVSTISSLAARSGIFNVKHFDLAIIDEAGQVLEPNLMGILSAKNPSSLDKIDGEAITKFILIGDYKQLPAVVQQDAEESAVADPLLKAIELDDCAHSLFERLIRMERSAGRSDFVGTLRKQGRMHPDIAEFPNRYFYMREQLECVPLAHQRELRLPYDVESEDAADDFLKAHRVIFIPSDSCRQPNLSEKANMEEARIVADTIRRLYRQMGQAFNPRKSIGVIVPYRNQIALIRKELEKLNLPALADISIDTVERYQGSQRDVIIYSFTIQSRYQLEFLTAGTFEEDGQIIDRKLNVVITRARKQLILTGNEVTLRQNATFSKLLDYIKTKGGYKTK